MELNGIQGSNAYTNAQNHNPQVDNSQLREQNIQSSRADLDTETANAAQQAFEVDITTEARDRLAAETAEQGAPPAQTAPAEAPEAQENQTPAQRGNQLLNIVA